MAMAKTTINSSSFFVSSPGKARATIAGHGTKAWVSTPSRGINRASTAGDFLAEGNPTSQVRGNNTNRYSSKLLYKTTNTKTIRSEIGSACSIINFKSFKDRFSGGDQARGFGGGRLRFFLPNWQQITLDPVLLDTVRGYKLELTLPPIQNRIRAPPHFSHAESEKIDIEITALLDKGALNKVRPVSGQFLRPGLDAVLFMSRT